ncbi:MAG: hypothetical protein KDD61_16515 [Bdellovibrionales bacterium]|nr:hypothetical protein [Bdellovibrionales bacterium]
MFQVSSKVYFAIENVLKSNNELREFHIRIFTSQDDEMRSQGPQPVEIRFENGDPQQGEHLIHFQGLTFVMDNALYNKAFQSVLDFDDGKFVINSEESLIQP